jgi:hypothetical protein
MTDWHVVPDRSVGKAGVQIYRDGKYIMRIALDDLGIPEHEMELLCRWLPSKIGSLLEEPKQACSTCGCGKPSNDVQDADAVPDPFAKEIVPAAGNEPAAGDEPAEGEEQDEPEEEGDESEGAEPAGDEPEEEEDPEEGEPVAELSPAGEE